MLCNAPFVNGRKYGAFFLQMMFRFLSIPFANSKCDSEKKCKTFKIYGFEACTAGDIYRTLASILFFFLGFWLVVFTQMKTGKSTQMCFVCKNRNSLAFFVVVLFSSLNILSSKGNCRECERASGEKRKSENCAETLRKKN